MLNNFNNMANMNPYANQQQNIDFKKAYEEKMQQLNNLIQPQQMAAQQQQASNPEMEAMLAEYKKIPSVSEKIKYFEELKTELQKAEYEINKGFEDYYKEKTDPQFNIVKNIYSMLQELLNKKEDKGNNG